jgi:glycosyltransferase involved in cell wall biosynthesis
MLMAHQKKTHLLYFVSEDWYFVSHRLSLARAALEAGYDVTVVTRVRDHGDEIQRAGIRLIAFPLRRAGLNPLLEMSFLLRLWRIYRRVRPDIVHHVAMKPVILGTLAAKLAGVPGIVNALGGLGFVFSSSSLKARLLRPLMSVLLRFSLNSKHGVLILQNGDDSELLVKRGFVRRSAIRLVRGVGVDPTAYRVDLPADNPCLVILPARMLRDKGVYEFVAAARQLRDEGVPARFALVGEPDDENPASLKESELQGWAQEGLIEYWGWRDDMADVMVQSHVVCLPSYREGLPKVLLEAAASGRAIVTTDVPGCREVVRNGFNGLLVPMQDADALAQAIRTLVLDADKRRQFGLNGRQLAETEFSMQQSTAATLAIYSELGGSK